MVATLGVAASVVTVYSPSRTWLEEGWFLGWLAATVLGAAAYVLWRAPHVSARAENDVLRARFDDLRARVSDASSPTATPQEVTLTLTALHSDDRTGAIQATVSNPSRCEIDDLVVTSLHPDVRVTDVTPTVLQPLQFPFGVDAEGEPYERTDAEPRIDMAIVDIECDGDLPREWEVLLSYSVRRSATHTHLVHTSARV